MPRFHLHIHDRGGFVPDEEGLDVADLDAALDQAVKGIGSSAGEQVRGGMLSLDGRVEIADPSGVVLGVVRYADAVELRLPDPVR